VRSGYERTYGETNYGGIGYIVASDLFRYKLLYEKGGWYFDTDCLLLKPLTPLFDRDYVFGWELETSVNNAVLKFPKGDELLDQLYKECVQINPETYTPWTVHTLFHQYLKKFNLIDQALPRNYFYPISPREKEQQLIPEAESSYILHLFATVKRFAFDQAGRIKLLEMENKALKMQIDALNKSLSLRIARKIPFGEEIRKILVKDASNRKSLPSK
jgi:hypothetical protein